MPSAETLSVQARQQRATLSDFVELLRPAQWVKNVVVFAGPAAALKLASVGSVVQAGVAFFAFCLAASASYAVNDAVDSEADASHPIKRHRPVARGAIKPMAAATFATILIIIALFLTAIVLTRAVSLVLLAYFILTLTYSFALKKRIILDVIVIATGFVLRAWAGSLAVGVATSHWLVACMFTLCLFMGFGKRRCELAMIGNMEEAGLHRRTLLRYTPDLLNHLITVSAGIAVVTFLLYTMDIVGSTPPFNKEYLFYTLPIVVYGVFRFAMLTEAGAYSGPTEIVLKDKATLLTILIWAAVALMIAYERRLFGPRGLAGLFGWL